MPDDGSRAEARASPLQPEAGGAGREGARGLAEEGSGGQGPVGGTPPVVPSATVAKRFKRLWVGKLQVDASCEMLKGVGMVEQIGLSQEKQKEIIEALRLHGANRPCPRCGNGTFELIDGYAAQSIQTEVRGIVIGGRAVPTVLVACNRCGWLAQHALGALGLLEKGGEIQ